MVNTNILNIEYSVLMSLYIKENPIFLRESIESMLNQTIKPSEIVIVKDGPLTDELEFILEKYLEEYPLLFNIIDSKENLGLGRALNLGINYCKHELIARMDTDDISKPNRCEKEIEVLLKDEKISVIGSWVDEFSGNTENILSTRKVPGEYKDIYEYCKRRNPFNHPSVMYRKKDILEVGGYSNLRYGQDYELFGRMMIKGYQAKNISESLVYFRVNDNMFARRKNLESIKSYIDTVKYFKSQNYSSILDYLFVAITQMSLYLLPKSIVKKMYSLIRK